ncbi:hypothetical protein MEBOL_003993 [Melittangium boletus DSM 14713]|uniref:Uncharacterized protein n=1 Tax=Melittangium boletus DSM 14713 TaxID=1294270 RepID=A0A250IH93_9BACT|nr:hypothetical protein MEBOL_003993 [Melittangium boletus DSM 14713]
MLASKYGFPECECMMSLDEGFCVLAFLLKLRR